MYKITLKLILIFLAITILGCGNVKKSNHSKFDYKLYMPKETGIYNDLLIVFIGGSEGGFPKLYNSGKYTKYGATCLSLAYFDTDKTNKIFDKITLEYFTETIKYVQREYKLKDKKIVLFGYSKGAELSLLLSSLYRDIKGVFVINPSNVVFQSPGSLNNKGESSSWMLNNQELAYVPLKINTYKKLKNKRFRSLYVEALNSSIDKDAIIKVENINGPILLVSGQEDIVWPSCDMSNSIVDRLDKYSFPYWYKHISYPDTGHTVNPFYSMGGSFIGNIKSNKDMKKQVSNFLDEVVYGEI